MEIRRRPFGHLRDQITRLLADGPATAEELAERLDRAVPGDDPVGLIDDLLMDDELVLWHSDGYYRPDVLFAGTSFTKILTAGEVASAAIATEVLPLVDQLPDGLLAAGGLHVEICDPGARAGRVVLCGPPGWLGDLGPGDVCNVSFDGHQLLVGPGPAVPAANDTAEHTTDEAADDTAGPSSDGEAAELAGALRDAFDRQRGTDGTAELSSVVADALLDDPDLWRAGPIPPLDALVPEAGLSRFGAHVGRAGHDWAAFRINGALVGLTVLHRLDPDQQVSVIELEASFRAWRERGEAALDHATRSLRAGAGPASLAGDGEVAPATFDLLHHVLRAPAGEVRAWALALLSRAGEGPGRAGPLWLVARSERDADVIRAEQDLRDVLDVEPGYRPAIEELGWLAFERSRFAAAHQLLNRASAERIGDGEVTELIEELARPALAPARRDGPCPCGSGGSFERCHAAPGSVDPLVVRAEALYHKARRLVVDGNGLALWSLPTPPDRWAGSRSERREAFRRLELAGFGTDVLLFEGGGLRRFADLRHDILPGDELQLIEAWIGAARTVLRVDSGLAGGGFSAVDLLRDIKVEVLTGDPHPDLEPGLHLVARPLPVEGDRWRMFHWGLPILDTELDVALTVAGLDGMAIARQLLAPPSGERDERVVWGGMVEVGDVDRLRSWLDLELGPCPTRPGDTTGSRQPGRPGAGRVGHLEGVTVVGFENRLTIITDGEDRYQQLREAVEAAAGPTRHLAATGVEAGVLADEAALLRPADAEELAPAELRLAMLEIDTALDPRI